MKTVVTEIGSYKRQVEVEVDAQEVEPYLEKAYQSYQKKIHIDGFRKGKIPLSIIKKRFGEAIQAEVADELVQEFYKRALEEEKLPVVAPGKVQDVSFEAGKPLRFKAEVEVEPDITVAHYKGFKVEKEILKTTPDDVKRTLEILQEQQAERRPVEGVAESGHIIEGDIQALDKTGVPIIGQKWEKSVVELGKPPLGDVIQDQLLGVMAGDEKRFTILQPEPDKEGRMQDREYHYKIKVESVKEKILPELDDAFAKKIGDVPTLKELEENIFQRLKNQRELEAERLLEHRIADDIVKRNDFEVPPSMIENILTSSWEEYQKNPDRNIDEEQYRQENKPLIVWNVKWHLIQQKIVEMENLTITEQDVDEEIDKMAKATPKDEKKIRAQMKDAKRRQRLKDHLLERKLMAFLKENVKIKEVVLKKPRQQDSKLVTV